MMFAGTKEITEILILDLDKQQSLFLKTQLILEESESLRLLPLHHVQESVFRQ